MKYKNFTIVFKAYIVSPITGKWLYGTVSDVKGKHKTFEFIADNYSWSGYVTEFVEDNLHPIDMGAKLTELHPEALYKTGEFE